VADHVEETMTVGRECSDRRGPLITIQREVLVRKVSLPGIRHELATRIEFVSPRVVGAIEPSARSELPFRLCWQFFARPLRIHFYVFISDVNHRMICSIFYGTQRALRMAPVCARDICPPMEVVPHIHTVLRLHEDH